MSTILPDFVNRRQAELFSLLADGMIRDTTAEKIEAYIDSEFPRDRLNEYINTYRKPSEIPGYVDEVMKTVNSNSLQSSRIFAIIMSMLDSRFLAPALTNSTILLREMTEVQREQLLRSWRDSPIVSKNQLFKSVTGLGIATYVKLAGELHSKAVGCPERETRPSIYEGQKIDDFKYIMMTKPTTDGAELYLPDFDALIIGSGSGAGVVAHTLAEEGYKSIVLEKGKYFSNDEFNFSCKDGYTNLYEGSGTLISKTQQVLILAGSTFGGGSTVNWSACLKTPFKVRKEWYDHYGVDWAASEHYDNCMKYVWDKMGASLNGINHSYANQIILNGAEKLGYAAKPVAQNSGNHPNHNCGFCHVGCKYGIKQGSSNFWFRYAYGKGSEFMDQVKVLKINHSGGKAKSVLCVNEDTGTKFTIKGPKKIVVCGGSLNTPVILQNSGFKNKNIGSNLKLHPVTVLFGDFGKDVKMEPHNYPILTSVCTETDDLDGEAHGAKIETILHSPYLESAFLPWNSSEELRKNMLRYNNLAAMLIITRDASSGTVKADPKRPSALIIDYEVGNFDRNALLESILTAADLLYIEGAKEIIHPQQSIRVFKSDKPKDERSINDKEYQAWRKLCSTKKLSVYGPTYGSAHQMSSCRISGKGPKYGACDLKGKLYECSNIYVADASAMPTASGANPMISTMTIARLISLGIAKDLKSQPKL